MTTQRFGLVVLVAIGLVSVHLNGCAATREDPRGRESGGQDVGAIIGGKPATAYKEAVLVDMYQGGQMAAACSGALIAPNVVLTAGHCVHGFDGWQITAPFAGNQTAKSSKGVTKDWTNDEEYVDPNMHDLGLIILDSKIALDEYPAVANVPVKFGSNVVDIGRIDNGDFSDSALFVSQPHPVSDGANDGFPYDYSAEEIIQSGDSGGPVQIPGASPHTIVAVNSGAGSGSEVLARTDLVYDWIQQVVQQAGSNVDPNDPNNGGGGDPGAGGSDPGAGGSDPGAGGSDPGAGGSDPGGGGDCQGIGWEGTCTDEGVLLWCDGGELVAVDCAAEGLECVTLPGVDYSDCF